MEREVKESLSDLVEQNNNTQGKVYVALSKLQGAHPIFSRLTLPGLRCLL